MHLDQVTESSEVNMRNSVCISEQTIDLITAGTLEVRFGEDNKKGPQSPEPITRNATRIDDVSSQATDNEYINPKDPLSLV